MESNKNIFYCTNPINLLDGLLQIIDSAGPDFSDLLIFLPSRRAVRSLEKILTEKTGSAVLLPKLVALGEAPEDEDEVFNKDTVSNTTRFLVLSNLLNADASINNFSAALSVAHDLQRMQDYLENEGIDATTINWMNLVDEKYAVHFQYKARFLSVISNILPEIFSGKSTVTQVRNADIRRWIDNLSGYRRVIVCGSTASVPATADLMRGVSNLSNGYIILPGKIAGDETDFKLDTNPYYSIYKFLKSIKFDISDIKLIDTGTSEIDFYNSAFSNSGVKLKCKINAKLIECARESEEANAVAEIAKRAISENKSVLVITPDAAGNQRIAASLDAAKIESDFSGGRSGMQTPAGRAILNMFDDCIENNNDLFNQKYESNNFNLSKALIDIIDNSEYDFAPKFEIDSDDSLVVWNSISDLSDVMNENDIKLDITDIRAVVSDALSGISIRPQINTKASVSVLGTIESRMQFADVIILTGLNEGMFPARGYENAWLPRHICNEIGLPSSNRKVSLQALDFMNLSCGKEVYWLRSKTSGSNQTTRSRFLSRVDVTSGGIETDTDILNSVLNNDKADYNPLDYSSPKPPAENSDIFVTKFDLLLNNPYAFYVNHILGLRPKRDFWETPDARDFGNLVHDVAQELSNMQIQNESEIIDILDKKAKHILPDGSALFHFWHKRFVDIAPFIKQMLDTSPNGLAETSGSIKIADRIIRAKADRIWENHVLDIKTGAAPNKKQLITGNAPQLPLEAFIMKSGGFQIKGANPIIQFLQLRNNDIKLIEYDSDTLKQMMESSVEKVTGLIRYYSTDYKSYEYRETSDAKYRAYDDFARVDD